MNWHLLLRYSMIKSPLAFLNFFNGMKLFSLVGFFYFWVVTLGEQVKHMHYWEWENFYQWLKNWNLPSIGSSWIKQWISNLMRSSHSLVVNIVEHTDNYWCHTTKAPSENLGGKRCRGRGNLQNFTICFGYHRGNLYTWLPGYQYLV